MDNFSLTCKPDKERAIDILEAQEGGWSHHILGCGACM
jgi:hypothetical protein